MDKIDINDLLNRTDLINNIITTINYIEENKNLNNIKKCIYIHGNSGVGKSYLINQILLKLNYNTIDYNIFSLKYKNIDDFFNEYNNKTIDILNVFNKILKKNVIFIDNIDIVNNTDKNTISNLIKVLKPKKYKRQNNEKTLPCLLICIGNNILDKKIKELIKISNVFEFLSPTDIQVNNILTRIMPSLHMVNNDNINNINNIVKYINYDLRKINNIYFLYENGLIDNYYDHLFADYIKNIDVKYITNVFINNKCNYNDDLILINDNDKTTLSLLYHENIIDNLNLNMIDNIKLYLLILNVFCFCDYMDRIIFQKQIWQLNEISFKLKVIYNNHIFHNNIQFINSKSTYIRFTKILCKYCCEFFNYIFLFNLSQLLNIDKKDLFLFFTLIKNNTYNKDIYKILHTKYTISLLEINRMVRFINNYLEYVN
jgi:hypothetical protein